MEQRAPSEIDVTDNSPVHHLGETVQLDLPQYHKELLLVYDDTLRRCRAGGHTSSAAHLRELVSDLQSLLRTKDLSTEVSHQAYYLLVSCYHARRLRKRDSRQDHDHSMDWHWLMLLTRAIAALATHDFQKPKRYTGTSLDIKPSENIEDHLDALDIVFNLPVTESQELLVHLTRLVCDFLKPEPLTEGFNQAKRLLEPASFVLGGGPSGVNSEGKSALLTYALLSEVAGQRLRQYDHEPRRILAMDGMRIVVQAADEVPEPYRSSLKLTITAMVWEDLGKKELDRTYNVWIDDLPVVVPDLLPSDEILNGMSSALLFVLLPYACRMAMGVWARNRKESRWLYRAHELALRMANMHYETEWDRYESLMLLSYCYLHQGFYESEQGTWNESLCHLNEGCKLKQQALALLERQISDGSSSEHHNLRKKLVSDRLFLANNLVRKVIIQVRHAHRTTKSDVEGDMQTAIRLAEDAVTDEPRLTVENVTLLGTLSAWLVVLNKTTAIETIILAAVKAFPDFIFRNLSQDDHVRQMANLYMVGDLACASALNCGKGTFAALSRLEACRAVFLSSRLEKRRLGAVSGQDTQEFGSQSDLEAHLDFLSLPQISQEPSGPNEKSLGPDPVQDTGPALTEERPAHQELSDHQLSPFREQDLSYIRDYTVVVINTTWKPLGSHALIIRNGKINKKPVPLLDAPQAQIEERVRAFRRSLAEESQLQREQAVHPILRWLWQAIVHPILTCSQLGIDGPPRPEEELPHIWWVPSALLSQLPLHGAGDCKPGSRNSALDWVISSYIPSVKVLLELHRSRKSHKVERALLVSVSDPDEHSTLVHAKSEVLAVKEKLERALLKPSDVHVLHNPTKEDFISLVEHSQIFHFAGHGQAHPVDPSQSYLVLPNKEKLTGEDLISTGTTEARPWLAYLSACSTGRTYEERLMNESSHLNSAFLLAGFQHVVGTLWQVSDLHSQKLACSFYSKLEDTLMNLNGNGVALALNLATRELRNKLAGQLDEADMRLDTVLADERDDIETYNKQLAPVVDDDIQYMEEAMRKLENWRDLGSKRKGQKDGGKALDKAYFTWTAYVHMGM